MREYLHLLGDIFVGLIFGIISIMGLLLMVGYTVFDLISILAHETLKWQCERK